MRAEPGVPFLGPELAARGLFLLELLPVLKTCPVLGSCAAGGRLVTADSCGTGIEACRAKVYGVCSGT